MLDLPGFGLVPHCNASEQNFQENEEPVTGIRALA
jgi:hypothetical protein